MMNGGENDASWLRWRTLWNPQKADAKARGIAPCGFPSESARVPLRNRNHNSVIAIALASGVFVLDGSAVQLPRDDPFKQNLKEVHLKRKNPTAARIEAAVFQPRVEIARRHQPRPYRLPHARQVHDRAAGRDWRDVGQCLMPRCDFKKARMWLQARKERSDA